MVWLNAYVDTKQGESVVGDHGVVAASMSPDGRRALLASNKLMLLWDLETDEEWHRLEHPEPVRRVSFSVDGRQAVSCTDAAVRVWELPPGRQPQEPPPVTEVGQFIDIEAKPSLRPPGALGHVRLAAPWGTVRAMKISSLIFIHPFAYPIRALLLAASVWSHTLQTSFLHAQQTLATSMHPPAADSKCLFHRI